MRIGDSSQVAGDPRRADHELVGGVGEEGEAGDDAEHGEDHAPDASLARSADHATGAAT